ncbi:MAG TPA: hypothetical protein VKV95_11735 [Terriglobia bacterium]|nr:hypothetical protein [Terriglobia bacterium]
MKRILIRMLVCFACTSTVWAQDFKLLNQDVQVHGFASQGFVSTDGNNWLTMKSGDIGSGQFTDFGGNASVQITDKFRIGAQIYDRNLGQLGKWHPQLDWAEGTYKFNSWFGIRGGKVKTVMGLYNDTQDLDFLHTFAILPQSIYPMDLRDVTIAHTGGDVFGDVSLRKKGGTLSYTAYVGHRQDSPYGGYAYLIGPSFNRMGGLQFGGDLRWTTPLKGLLVGVSRLNENISAQYAEGTPNATTLKSKVAFTNQYFAQYKWNKLVVDSEYRRYDLDATINGGPDFQTYFRGWYVAGSYRVAKHVQLGSYYSHYAINVPVNFLIPPGNGFDHDKVVTARFDINRFFNIKVEGHFMHGFGMPDDYPNGFYSVDNPQGLKPNTTALVVKTSFKF